MKKNFDRLVDVANALDIMHPCIPVATIDTLQYVTGVNSSAINDLRQAVRIDNDDLSKRLVESTCQDNRYNIAEPKESDLTDVVTLVKSISPDALINNDPIELANIIHDITDYDKSSIENLIYYIKSDEQSMYKNFSLYLNGKSMTLLIGIASGLVASIGLAIGKLKDKLEEESHAAMKVKLDQLNQEFNDQTARLQELQEIHESIRQQKHGANPAMIQLLEDRQRSIIDEIEQVNKSLYKIQKNISDISKGVP